MDRCLDCRACETVCPSGVEYGKLIEHARGQIQQEYRRPFFSRMLGTSFTESSSVSEGELRRWGTRREFISVQGCSGWRALRRAELFGLAEREKLMPAIDREFFFSRLGKTFPAIGMTCPVAFFAGCVAQVSFTELNDATIRVLQANGCEVVVPAAQLCCGALCVHAGVRDVAADLARANLAAFLAEPFDAIVTNAAGCGSTLKEYDQLFPADTSEHTTGN